MVNCLSANKDQPNSRRRANILYVMVNDGISRAHLVSNVLADELFLTDNIAAAYGALTP